LNKTKKQQLRLLVAEKKNTVKTKENDKPQAINCLLSIE